MRILYLADIRFPLERANGIQSMETCHALAARGHEVSLLVRPDSHTPPRDPFAFYGLPRLAAEHGAAEYADYAGKGILRIEVVPVAGPASYRRAGYLAFAIGRAMGRGRQDLIFTRDLGLASLLLRIPASRRAAIVYEAHGIAADVAAALPGLLTGASEASPAKLRRLARRDAHVWKGADGYVTITSGLASELWTRLGERQRLAVVPDGVRSAAKGTADEPAASPPAFTIGYAGHLYPWKGVDLVAAVAARLRGADVLALPNPASSISSTFTSPLKLFEYMASGRPIVASDLASLREVLRNGKNALLVEPGNPQALAAGIQRLKDDAALGRRLAEQAMQDVREFTWARRAERLEALFDEVLEVSASAVKRLRRDRLP